VGSIWELEMLDEFMAATQRREESFRLRTSFMRKKKRLLLDSRFPSVPSALLKIPNGSNFDTDLKMSYTKS
jgi:hypothetical protein